jgi:uncharacterized membrane protein YjgN (DUF898 family)
MSVPALEPKTSPITFTGSGAEYFRIWIVNLILSYLTLGIYSAWAKVRREKYFHQNTQLEGASLDYHGQPVKILIGRIVSLGLLAISTKSPYPILGYFAFAIILVAFPFFMQRSLRFRFKNSSYRGLRFGFTGSVKTAYRTLIPFMIVPTIYALAIAFAVLFPEDAKAIWLGLSKVSAIWISLGSIIIAAGYFAFMPLLQGTWRRFTINHTMFGFVRGGTTIALRKYINIHATTGLVFTLLIGVAIATLYFIAASTENYPNTNDKMLPLILYGPWIAAVVYLGLLATRAAIAARIQNYNWNRNTLVLTQGNRWLAEFKSDLSVTKYSLLIVKNWVLIIITLGLYRPFAVVSAMRMRLEAISLHNSRFLDHVIAKQFESSSAIGEEALDAFDLEFSI